MSEEAVIETEVTDDSSIEATEADLTVEGSGEGSELSVSCQVSALLFASSKPLTVEDLAETIGADESEIQLALEEVQSLFSEEQHGFSLKEVSGGWQLRSAAKAQPVIAELLSPRARRLSRAAAETLAVIAYRQPIQRAEIEAIRGVDALPTLKTLLDARLIRIVGREDSPGQPALYGTTKLFLERFGLKDLSELPSIREVELLSQEAESQEKAEDEVEELGLEEPSESTAAESA